MARSESPTISVSRRGSSGGDANCTVVWVRGDHDIATKGSLVATVARAGQLEDVDLLVDLSGVTFMDASTVGALVGSRNRLRSHGRSLGLRAPSPRAFRVLELCGLTHLVRAGSVDPAAAGARRGAWPDVGSVDLTQPHKDRAGYAMASKSGCVLAAVDGAVDDAWTTVEEARGP